MIFPLLGMLLLFMLFLGAKPALAVCPVCTVAVGAGLGLSRWLGIDDTVSGLWVGGLILSSALWFDAFIEKRNVRLPGRKILSILLFFLLTLPPLYLAGIIGHPLNKLWGIDKLLLGTTFGSVLFLLSVFLDKYLRSRNRGKVYFHYQKVIIPVLTLVISSLVFYIITK